MTTNLQLEAYVKRHKLPQNNVFLGVFPSDQLPDSRTPNASLIVNYSPNNAGGTHWVAMRKLNTRLPEYFDSYGLPPDAGDPLLSLHTNFTNYLKEHSTTGQYIYNTFDLQSWKQGQSECGEWSMWFIYHGIPSPHQPAWVTYLNEKDGVKRDEMIKSRLGIRRD